MTVLWALPAIYLLLGGIGSLLVRWRVQLGCPLFVIAQVVGTLIVIGPYLWTRHREWPWRMTMDVWKQ